MGVHFVPMVLNSIQQKYKASDKKKRGLIKALTLEKKVKHNFGGHLCFNSNDKCFQN